MRAGRITILEITQLTMLPTAQLTASSVKYEHNGHILSWEWLRAHSWQLQSSDQSTYICYDY